MLGAFRKSDWCPVGNSSRGMHFLSSKRPGLTERAFYKTMDTTMNTDEDVYERATKKLTTDLQRSLERHFGLDEKTANWKANLAIEMIEANSFIAELIEEADEKTRTKNAMRAILEAALSKAFAEVFDIPLNEASEQVSQVMGLPEANDVFERLVDKYRVSPSIHGEADELEEPPPIWPS